MTQNSKEIAFAKLYREMYEGMVGLIKESEEIHEDIVNSWKMNFNGMEFNVDKTNKTTHEVAIEFADFVMSTIFEKKEE